MSTSDYIAEAIALARLLNDHRPVRPVRPDLLTPGSRFGAYEIGAAVGSGTFGVVYEARTLSLGKRIALKVLHPQYGADATQAERFRREAEIVAQLHHPHIVDIYDRGEEDGRLYIAMEFLEGEPLTAMLKREGPLPVQMAINLLLPVLSAASAVHARNIVHRDIKPGNIYLTRPRPGVINPKLLDFGLVRVHNAVQDITRVDASLGTPNYMSPEQVTRPRDVDARSDVWSLAVTLYVMLTCERPFAGPNDHITLANIVESEPRRLRELRPDVPAAIDEAVWRSLRKSRDARPASARELAAALLPFGSRRAQEDFASEFADEADGVELLDISSPAVADPSHSQPSHPLPVVPVAPPVAQTPVVAAAPLDGPSDPSSYVGTRASPPGSTTAQRASRWITASALLVLAAAGGLWYTTRRTNTATPLVSTSSPPDHQATQPATPATPAPIAETPGDAATSAAPASSPTPPEPAAQEAATQEAAEREPHADTPPHGHSRHGRGHGTGTRHPTHDVGSPLHDPNGVPILR